MASASAMVDGVLIHAELFLDTAYMCISNSQCSQVLSLSSFYDYYEF